MNNKANILKWITGICWSVFAIAMIALLISASKKKEQQICKNIEVSFENDTEQNFLSSKEVIDLVNTVGDVRTKSISQIDIRLFEEALIKNVCIKSAKLYFDNQETLHVFIQENKPFVRVFTTSGSSFYFDEDGVKLPLSEKMNIRIPIVTGFTSDNENLSRPDSLLKEDILLLARFIQNDTFWMAQTSQININENREFEWVPLIGNHIVEIGDVSNLDNKFNKLFSFYKNVWAKTSSEEYAVLKLQFKNQIVAIKKSSEFEANRNKILQDSTVNNLQSKINVSNIAVNNNIKEENQTILIKQPKAILKN